MTAEQDRHKQIDLAVELNRLMTAILRELRTQRKILNGIRVVSKKTLENQKIANKQKNQPHFT